MTRQIKFRAWEIDWKNNDQEQGRMIQWEDIRDDFSQILSKTSNFIPMQFTGLLDKNGKEIYEGDLIECYANDGEKVYTYPHIVKLPDFYREIWSENEHKLPADLGQKTKVLIVGNIYQNPELLK